MATIKHTAQLARIEHKLDVIDSRTAYLSRVVNNVQNASDAIWQHPSNDAVVSVSTNRTTHNAHYYQPVTHRWNANQPGNRRGIHIHALRWRGGRGVDGGYPVRPT